MPLPIAAAGLALLALMGCRPTETADSTFDDAVAPTEWVYAGAEAAPDLDADTLAAGAEVAVGLLAGLDPVSLYEGYAEALSNGDATCPGSYPAIGVTTGWANDCMAA